MVDHLITALRWQQITAMARMAQLAAPLAAWAIALAAAGTAGTAETRSPLARSVTGGWLGGIPGAAALLLLQLGDTGGKGRDLVEQRLVLLSELTVLLKQLPAAAHPRWSVSLPNQRGEYQWEGSSSQEVSRMLRIDRRRQRTHAIDRIQPSWAAG